MRTRIDVEILKFLNFKLPFYHMISQSSKLKVLQLWDVEFHVHNVVWDVKMKSVCFPQLRHVCLHHDPRDDMIQNSFLGSSQLVKVDELELGWSNEFFLVARFLDNYPNIKKLTIIGYVTALKKNMKSYPTSSFP